MIHKENYSVLKQFVKKIIDGEHIFQECEFSFDFPLIDWQNILRQNPNAIPERLEFINCKFHSGFEIKNTEETELIFRECRITGSITGVHLIFNKDLKFIETEISGNIQLENCEFKENFYGSFIRADSDLKLSNNKYHKLFELSGYANILNSINSEFCGEVSIHDLSIKNESLFNSIVARSFFKINKCSFGKKVDSSKAVFHKGCSLINSRFKQFLILSNVKMLHSEDSNNTLSLFGSNISDISLHGIEINGSLNAAHAKFTKGLLLSLNDNIEEINFSNTLIDQTLELENLRINILNLGYLSVSNLKMIHVNINKMFILKFAMLRDKFIFYRLNIADGDREAFRLLKHEYLKINNKIESLNFLSKEMRAYHREIRRKSVFSKDRWVDGFVLLTNQVSNGYGLNHWRALGFTIISGLVFFTIIWNWLLNEPTYMCNFENDNQFWNILGNCAKHFVRFINPTHKYNMFDEFSPKNLAYVIDAIGRIFIGFGIYQFVQAFRKFGK